MGETVLKYQQILETHTCSECGIEYAAPEGFWRARLKDRRVFYCPNGHTRVLTGETEAQRLQKELEQERAAHERSKSYLANARSSVEHAERRRRAAVGVTTKLRKRVGKGACPCCNRFFPNLHRHMTTVHPDYAAPAPEEQS